MRAFDAEQTLLQDLKDEGHIVLTKETEAYTVTAVRHPTLGKLVIVEGLDGQGVVVEAGE
ncbi:hypothetical protein ABC977_12115 [Thioalkalicoccus limnaeus]|uniref:Uncharacterized protein n=1 Tax=Thioalkalicoccus limnaeus TaxID=120681 RepID=A0ABV4BFV2_9GAMM